MTPDSPLPAVPVDPLTAWRGGGADGMDAYGIGLDSPGDTGQGWSAPPTYGPQQAEMQPTVTIRPRPRGASSSASDHPFKIETAVVANELRAYVGFGMATAMVWTGSKAVLGEIKCMFDSGGTLKNDPVPVADTGYEVISLNKIYGVWHITSIVETSVTNGSVYVGAVGGSTIGITEDYPNPSDGQDYADALGDFACTYLGQIDTTDGVVVRQYRRSDITIPSLTIPAP